MSSQQISQVSDLTLRVSKKTLIVYSTITVITTYKSALHLMVLTVSLLKAYVLEYIGHFHIFFS